MAGGNSRQPSQQPVVIGPQGDGVRGSQMYYHRGLSELENEKGRLVDACLDGQDIFIKLPDMPEIDFQEKK